MAVFMATHHLRMSAMLILNRTVGEYFSINQNITLRVVAVNGNHVRLGIEAPRDVVVHRAEIYERIKNEHAENVPSMPLDKG